MTKSANRASCAPPVSGVSSDADQAKRAATTSRMIGHAIPLSNSKPPWEGFAV